MHILLDYRPALRERTGVGEYVHHLSAALLRRIGPSDRVTLFSSSWKDRLTEVPAGATPLDLRIPVRLLNFAWHRLEWPPVERLGAAPDVAWSLHPLLLPARRAAQVVTVYDLFFLDQPDATVREIRRDYPALAAAHARRAQGIVTISEYTRRSIAERFDVPIDKIAVCAPGAPDWTRRDSPSRIGPILHVGTVEPRKNIGAIIRAYAQLVRTVPAAPPLVFAGRISSPLAPLLAGLDPSIASRIAFKGYVPDAERRALYADASLLVIASRDEGFGMPAVEAMTVGVPVVAANRGALPEVIGDAGLLVDADDPVVLASAMQRVLGGSDLAGDLARRGVARARRFTWDESAAVLLEALRRAASAGRAAA